MDTKPNPDTTAHNSEKRQVDDKTEKRVRIRSGQGTVAYWKARLFRNSYKDRDGKTVEIPEYYVRIRHDGLTKRVRLHNSEQERAAEEALALSLRVADEGWAAVTAGQARLPASPTVKQFCEAYELAAAAMESPPRAVTIALYLRHLKQLCALAGVSRLRELTPDAIARARDKYRAKARAAKRVDSAIQNSLSIIIRNAAACFSSEARTVMARQGSVVGNPFEGIKRPQKIEPVTALDREIISAIWRDLPKLRDGDPEAQSPNLKRFHRSYGKKHEGRTARWLPMDWSRPHPDAYCAILLALGLGLRANEIDKARWSWLSFDQKGECYLKIAEETDFKPKGGTLRLIRVPKELHEELTKTRTDLTSPYILGGVESEKITEKGWGYRRRDTLRAVNAWLRERGVECDEIRGNPLHRLRKQFGSEVATQFGLFAAQKLLGHSSPTVTAAYYAAQTELPNLSHVRIVK